jgi:hypothetical protein
MEFIELTLLFLGNDSTQVNALSVNSRQVDKGTFGIPIACLSIKVRPVRDAPTVGAIPGFRFFFRKEDFSGGL